MGRVVTKEMDVWVAMEVRIGVEFPGHELVNLLELGGKDKGQAADLGVEAGAEM